MIVHPWQYDHTIGGKFSQWIASKILIPTPFTVESKATLSFRTMDLIHKPYHVKLPVNVQATSAVRTVSTVTTVDGPKLSYALQGLLDQYPGLQVAMEPFVHMPTWILIWQDNLHALFVRNPLSLKMAQQWSQQV